MRAQARSHQQQQSCGLAVVLRPSSSGDAPAASSCAKCQAVGCRPACLPPTWVLKLPRGVELLAGRKRRSARVSRVAASSVAHVSSTTKVLLPDSEENASPSLMAALFLMVGVAAMTSHEAKPTRQAAMAVWNAARAARRRAPPAAVAAPAMVARRQGASAREAVAGKKVLRVSKCT